MPPPLLLWIDLTASDAASVLRARLEEQCRLRMCNDVANPGASIQVHSPDVLCFEFDCPDQEQLNLLQKTKLQFPAIPILMFTSVRSAELILWALRARVWDCFIKPVSAGEILRRLNIMLPVLGPDCGQRARRVLMPQRTPLTTDPRGDEWRPAPRTEQALRHLLEHYPDKISLAEMAERCAMDSAEFSRAFKREQGCTFREFLQRARIEAAADRLRNSRQSVIDIACAVGFNDPSHFTRQFRLYMGVTPSAYRDVKLRLAAAQPFNEASSPTRERQPSPPRPLGP